MRYDSFRVELRAPHRCVVPYSRAAVVADAVCYRYFCLVYYLVFKLPSDAPKTSEVLFYSSKIRLTEMIVNIRVSSSSVKVLR